jgi:hypothetical protein
VCCQGRIRVASEHAYWQQLGISLKDSAQPREQALAAQLLDFAVMGGQADAQATATKAGVDPAIASAVHGLIAKVNTSNDPVALSLATQVGVKQQDQRAISTSAARWQAVEPDNLAPRLFSGIPIGSLLASARDTTRYETHGYEQVRSMTSVFKRWPMSREEMGSGYPIEPRGDEERAAVSAFAIWAAYGIPGLQPLTNACRDKALLSTPARRDDCLHVAKVLVEDSSDMVSRSIGISMLERAAGTPDDIALAIRLRRNNEWQRHQYYLVLMQQMDEQQQIRHTLRLLNTPGVDNEIQLMETALREKGIALTPPGDWQPPKRS